MEFDEEKLPQCPAGSAVGRRKGEESRNKTVELTLGMKTSKPVVSFELSSCFCKDSESCMCKNRLFDSPSPLCLSPATAAAQTQMLSTEPKAMALIACRQLTDGNEAASLRDQSPLPILTLKGTVSLERSDPRRPRSVHASITGTASVSAADQNEAPGMSLHLSKEGKKRQYYHDLCLQVEERKQQVEKERQKKAVDDQKHNETQQQTWGMPRSGAQNHQQGTVKRSRNLDTAGILPQEQIRDKGFTGTPFHRL
ncbi:uncharacterized protein [Pseudochaenichthys georgianus]|uniref:uncharacterized protein isoform X1 n=2 Tax=Pseudochaenichthys georgianus TaxID=52239 RepID=UPI00146B4B6B|nr:uncharacterized protein LOC117465954 isoform X1 [Pseudochaenichthys georgianus]